MLVKVEPLFYRGVSMRWSLFKEKVRGNEKWVIRGWKDGKYCRLPSKKYQSIRDNEAELIQLVKRLNAPEDAKLKVSFKHAFINDALMEEYLRYLTAQIPSESGARQEYSYLKRHVLNFFIGKLDLMNPLDWHRVHETQWAEHLLGPDAPKAAKTKRDIVIAANRFIGWLHKQRPEEVPPLEFKPLSRAKLKDIEAHRELNKEIRIRGLIPEKDMKTILNKAPKHLLPFINLAYHYGLRRAETLGVKSGDVKKGFLALERQMVKLEQFKPLKGKSKRSIPHWFCKAAEAYKWIEDSQSLLINPSTLTHEWNELMGVLEMSWDFHDLRHSFITKAIRLHASRDVQLAAGHKDIRTTMGYAHDDRELEGDEFVPGETG